MVIEGKPKRTPKLVTLKPTGSKENPVVERKNVRRKRIDISFPAPPTKGSGLYAVVKTITYMLL